MVGFSTSDDTNCLTHWRTQLKKPFSFRRKSSDERSQRRESDSHSPHSSLRSSIASGPRKSSKVEEPLGLNVVYTPEHRRHVDIVFIHGLGGTSRLSWSKHKNLNLFWPLTFLPREPDLCQARILTFGYNASIHKAGNVGTSVLDFAKDLLFDLKYAQDEQKEELNMGDVSELIPHGQYQANSNRSLSSS